MSRLIVHSFTISLDGYGAGPNQSKETPLGEAGEELHEWLVGTRFFKQMGGREGGATGIDNDFAEHGMGIDLPRLGYGRIRCTSGEKAVHYVITRG